MAESAPPASMGTRDFNATGAGVDSLPAAFALPAPDAAIDSVDQADEPSGLQERETDPVLDKTSTTDPLYAKTIESFQDETLSLPPLLLRG